MPGEGSNKSRKRSDSSAVSATELFSGAPPTEAKQQGRRLVLKFLSKEKPELDRIEFCAQGYPTVKPRHLQKADDSNPGQSIRAAAVTRAMPLLFLDYLCGRMQQPPKACHMEGETGSPAATIGNALTDTNGVWRKLFFEDGINRVGKVFGGTNFHGKGAGQRVVFVQPDYLPPDCIDVYWRGKLITEPEELRELTSLFRKAWKLPPSTEQELPEEKPEPPPPVEAPPPNAKPPKPKADKTKPSGELFPEATELPPAIFGVPPPKTDKPKPGPAPPPKTEPPTPKAKAPEEPHQPDPCPEFSGPTVEPKPWTSPEELVAAAADATDGKLFFEFKIPEGKDAGPEIQSTPAIKPIPRELFEIQNPNGHAWDDFEPLLNFGNDDSDLDAWRVRDACEGILIFGAVGSGKTSGSGATVARAFLQAGFGGLVLTVKPDEAARWERMCRETGRESDFIHVAPTSGHKLNFLQYELQRPGERLAVTEDLITLFRALINTMSRSKNQGANEEFWTNTTNQLMRKMVEVFLLAGEPVSLDRMVRFINRAPLDKDTDWRKTEMFADVLQRAQVFARTEGTEIDRRVFGDCLEYWTQTFPKVTDATRSGFITAFTSMADVLSGRGIYEMLGTETNLTPEMILSGKVVVLDIPLKGNIQGGLMVQAMFKLLFQQAVERRGDKGKPTARPAFLWEDEGHMFFSQHDVNFQPTARDVRAPHVILSQNLHNFYQQGHNQHAIEAVFSAMNTLFFHTNGDMTTNKWASEKIGEIRKLKLTTDGLLRPMVTKDYTFLERRPEEVKNVGKMSIKEERKSGLPPEDFARLKRGGDGMCEAVLLWLSHQFAANGNRNFCVVTFAQEPK
jgi:hypothetical protein